MRCRETGILQQLILVHSTSHHIITCALKKSSAGIRACRLHHFHEQQQGVTT